MTAEANNPEAPRAVFGWSQRARSEWASVPAFAQLAAQLVECGAPSGLVRRAMSAARDEVQHTVLAASIAAGLARGDLRVAPADAEGRQPVHGADGLVRLAVESWTDGCNGEGLAAACAHEEAQRAGPQIAPIATSIAADEAAHAELAWDVLAWSLETGGEVVHDALDAELRRGFDASTETFSEETDGLDAFGLLGSADTRRTAERVRDDAARRLRTLLQAA